MTTLQPSLSLTVRLTKEKIGFLAHFYPNADPEDALIKLRAWFSHAEQYNRGSFVYYPYLF